MSVGVQTPRLWSTKLFAALLYFHFIGRQQHFVWPCWPSLSKAVTDLYCRITLLYGHPSSNPLNMFPTTAEGNISNVTQLSCFLTVCLSRAAWSSLSAGRVGEMML